MTLTPLVAWFFKNRQHAIQQYADQTHILQHRMLRYLVSQAADTEYGLNHGFKQIHRYEDFQRCIPVNTYEDLKDMIERMRHGEKDILWKGAVRWFAKSSGTTNDKSKFIPVTNEGLKRIHYAGGRDAVALYLQQNPQSRLFDGKGLILGGSHSPTHNLHQSVVGDLSAILIENINPLVNWVRTPRKEIALLADFEEKRERIAQETLHSNITNLSGVPSWMLSVLVRVLELSGKEHLGEVWQNLEVFFHGGIAFGPYREQYRRLIQSPKMHYMETYNASEGFFGLQNDLNDPAMLLMTDYDVFYEFIPMNEFGSENPTVVPLEGVEPHRNYAMLITTSCGLWRYLIGDTVMFTQTHPYKFIITGRTKYFINAFGEELIQDNAEKALAKVCKEQGVEISEYTAAPVFMNDKGHCRHQWLIEFITPPTNLRGFAAQLDAQLRVLNSDYDAKRSKNITLQQLEVIVAQEGLFTRWLKDKGKLGGQHKVPRLSNTRQHIDELLALNGTATSSLSVETALETD